jgi:hypothetical protein
MPRIAIDAFDAMGALPQCMSLEVARLRHPRSRLARLLSGEDRK